MALSRSFRRTLGIASIAALLTAGLIAPPAQADDAIIFSITVNCSNWSASTITEVTGKVDDTFEMINNGASSCTVTHNGAITGSGTIPSGGGKRNFTIVKDVFFTITDGLMVPHNITVKLPGSVPGPVIAKIDADGGKCGVAYFTENFVFPGAEGDECSKDGYELVNWTIPGDKPGATYAPGDSFSFTAPERTAGFTIFANWKLAQDYNEITYNSMVPAGVQCATREPDGSDPVFGDAPDAPTVLWKASAPLASANPYGFWICTPKNRPNRFVGWNTESDGTGTPYYPPVANMPPRPFALDVGGQKVTLYAQWQDPCPTVEAKTGKVAPQAFEGAQWAGCNLTDANLTDANLTNANLTNAKLTDAKLTNAKLTNANLTGANLTGANLDGVISGRIIATDTPDLPTLNFNESDAGSSDGDGNWKLVNGYLVGPGANLTGANLTGADLSGADLSGAVLTGATLDGVISGNRSKIQGEVLRGGIFMQLDNPPKLPDGWMLRNHYLIGPKAILTDAHLAGEEDLSGANLAGANLRGAVLTDANLRGAVLTDANLARAKLQGAKLQGAKVQGAKLQGANLKRANLKRAKLQGANLKRANLKRANLKSANLAGAKLNGVLSGGIKGTPQLLPAGWSIPGGYLILDL
jgi:uncharacterized protein YjbI with pentapeptide repeats